MRLNKKKIISLDKFINKALYDSNTGFYIKKNPFGSKGDFITAPNISIMFSEMILIWIISFWKNLKCPKKINLVEMGAGNGEMMYQIIKTSDQFPLFNKTCNFYIYEKSPYLKKIQRTKLNKSKVIWINNLNNIKKVPTLFIGNEFFDSLPIKQFIKKDNNWYEYYIDVSSKNKKFIQIKKNIKIHEKKIGISLFKNQKFVEFSPLTLKILKKISRLINNLNGGILIIDYGYVDEKMTNTLQAIKNHKKTNILSDIGNADITYLLNFNLLKKIIEKLNLKVSGLTSQRNFLINLGIKTRAENLSKNLPFSNKANIYYRLKRLIGKNAMGELFKVMFVCNKKINFKIGFIND